MEKIHGKYPGNLEDPDGIKDLGELELFLEIEKLGYYIRHSYHEMFKKKMEIFDLTEDEYALEYLVYQTKNFDVKFPETNEKDYVKKTIYYQAWYDFYRDYFENVLVGYELDEFNYARENGEDLRPFYPKNSWKDYFNENQHLYK